MPAGTLRQRLFAWLLTAGSGPYERAMRDRKRALLGDLAGTVVEIGPGTGANLSFFGPDVRWVGVEPNPYARTRLQAEADRLGRPVQFADGTAAATGLPDASADAVVCTLVLCSVPDVEAALAEALRVLRPGGPFVFVEHVAAPAGTGWRCVQDAVRPAWSLVADGCRPNRETEAVIRRAGFASVEVERFAGPAPGVVRPHIAGTAWAPG